MGQGRFTKIDSIVAFRLGLIATSALSVSACATLSFAPPQVRMDQEVTATNNQTFFNAVCTPNQHDPKAQQIRRNVEGALLLVSNYVLTYRCQADRAAEGRQFFDVPSFLTAAGAATAAAFGAPADVAIGATAATGALGQGKAYYAPKDKAVVLNDGVDALLCIQNEAVGIDAYTLKALSNAQSASGVGTGGEQAPTVSGTEANAAGATPPADAPPTAPTVVAQEGPQVYVSAERQYFEMIRSALIAVERVVAQRLSAAGTPFDSAGIIAELDAIRAKQAEQPKPDDPVEAEEAGKDAKEAVQPNTQSGNQPESRNNLVPAYTEALNKLDMVSDVKLGMTVIKLQTLQPRLQQCIIHAKV